MKNKGESGESAKGRQEQLVNTDCQSTKSGLLLLCEMQHEAYLPFFSTAIIGTFCGAHKSNCNNLKMTGALALYLRQWVVVTYGHGDTCEKLFIDQNPWI